MNAAGAPQVAARDVVMIANVMTPYRLALHRRIDRELPALRLLTIYTHDVGDQAWSLAGDDLDRVFRLGQGDQIANASRPKFALHEWRKGGRIIEFLKARRPAAAFICGYNDPGRLRVIRWCAAHKLPLFLIGDSNVRTDTATGLKRLVKNAVVGSVVRACRGVMPFGSSGAAYFARYGGTPATTFYVPCEPDYELITNLPQTAIDAARARFKLDPARRRAVFCGRMIPEKRPHMALAAFLAIADQRPDLDLIMIGDGPRKAELAASVPPNLANRVLFTGFIGQQELISALYRTSELLIMPSYYEPWGLVVNEALAGGMAIVASDLVGAVPELVKDRVNGRIFPADDQPALNAAVLEATDPERLHAYRAASASVLAAWRREGNPIDGLRRALRTVGVEA